MDHRQRRPSVEYNLAEHCNLACANCDHASPLLRPRFARLADFVRDLSALSAVFHSEQLRFVGGEPLLHGELVDFLRAARDLGLADTLVVITNGVLLHRMPEAFWGLFDALWLSVYPGVRRTLSVEACRLICQERGIAFRADDDQTFHLTLVNNPVESVALRTAVFRSCRLANDISCHTVHEGRFYRCSVAPFQGARLAQLGIEFDNSETDGVALHDNVELGPQLARCLSTEEPLEACRFCLGTSVPGERHRQLDRNGLLAWRREDHRALIADLERRCHEGKL